MLRAALAALLAALCLTGLTVPAAAQQPAGTALAWGDNGSGQLGDGTTTERLTPVGVHLPAGTTVTALAGGGDFSLAVTSDGRVLAWGNNSSGQLGDGTTTDRTTPVEVHLPTGTTVTAVAAGLSHSLALTSDGRVLAWGYNAFGQLGDGTTTERLTPVEADLPIGTTVTALSAGAYFSLAVTSDGGALAWGYNLFGQLGDGTTTNRATPVEVHLPAGTSVTSVAGGGFHSLAVTTDGRALAWGYNAFGQLGDGTTTNRSTPVDVHLPTGTTVTAVAAGDIHSLALASDGRALAWGFNGSGQLGDGTTTNHSTPVDVHLPTGTTVTAVAAGDIFSLALASDGRVLAWGNNNFGQLGDGTTTERSTPVASHLPAGTTVSALAAGDFHSLAVARAAQSTTTLTAEPTTAAPGQPVTLTAHVTCSTGTPTGDVVFDDDATAVGTVALDPDGDAVLTTTGLALGAHRITARYQGDGSCPPSVSETVVVVVEEAPRPSLGLTKRAESTGPFEVGDRVGYVYTVTNTGNTALHGVTVTDDLAAGVTCDATGLAPGAITACHGSHVIAEADITPCRPAVGGCLLTNLAQATAFEPTGQEVASEQATATITVRRQQAAELTLAKRVVTPGPFRAGDRVVYAYTVTNTGDAALHDVAVTDDLVAPVTCATTTLAAGASTTCHGTYTVTRADVTPCAKSPGYGGGPGGAGCCEITNTAHATATDPQGDRITSNRATATIQVNGGKDDNCCERHGGYGKTS
ncbi:Ig-like domain repeat protein [Streptomyces murinus]|uniref:RCC1 domain-containing protein n=1 Tax=Streptomyces murinus TaxID=33900 RepID=UPI0036329893